jgi:hypothetical protein
MGRAAALLGALAALCARGAAASAATQAAAEAALHQVRCHCEAMCVMRRGR